METWEMHIALPDSVRIEVVSNHWGAPAGDPPEMLVFLPEDPSQFEIVHSIIYEAYLFAKGEPKVRPNPPPGFRLRFVGLGNGLTRRSSSSQTG